MPAHREPHGIRHDRRGHRRDSPGRDRHRRRRPGPRERGRLRHGRGEGHARHHQLHGHPRPGPGVPADDRRAPAELGLPPMVAGSNTTRTGPRSPSRSRRAHGVTTGISAHDRAPRIARAINPRTRRRTWSARPATSSRCARGRAACSSAPDRPRPPSTWLAWPGSTRRRNLRGDERGRHHGAPARPGEVARDHRL